MKIYYLTDKQFKQSDFYQSMKRNIDKWDALLGTTSSKLETEFDYLKLVGKMFEKYNYYWEFVPEKDCNPDTKEKKFKICEILKLLLNRKDNRIKIINKE